MSCFWISQTLNEFLSLFVVIIMIAYILSAMNLRSSLLSVMGHIATKNNYNPKKHRNNPVSLVSW